MLENQLKSKTDEGFVNSGKDSTEASFDTVNTQTEMGSESAAQVKKDIADAVSAQDAERLSSLMDGLSEAARSAISSDTSLMKQIIELPPEISHPALDKLYVGVQDVDLLRDMIQARFNVIAGTDRLTNADDKKKYEIFAQTIIKNHKSYIHSGVTDVKDVESPWTINGLVALYRMYINIPQAQLDKIKCVLTTLTSFLTAGLSWGGFYLFTYDDQNMDVINNFDENTAKKGGFMSEASDGRVGENNFDFTATHELGHVIDGAGTVYSNKPDFYALSGWKKLERNPEKLVEEMRQSFEDVSTADPEGYDSKEAKQVVDNVGMRMIQTTAYDDTKRDESIEKTLNDKKVKKLIKNSGKTREEFAATLKDAPLLEHVQRSFYAHTPWLRGEVFDGMSRQIHQDYSNTWYSYDSEAPKAGKISTYQYCNPIEEFAEIYAAYYVTMNHEKGSRIIDKPWFKKYQEWFEKTVIGKQNA